MKDFGALRLLALRILVVVLTPFQIVLLEASYLLLAGYFSVVGKKGKHRALTVGVTETARCIHTLGQIFPSSYTCVLDRNRFYNDRPSFGPYPLLLRAIVGPLLLAYCAHVSRAFVYISFTGFLADRRADFRFLKRHNKKIVTLFCGSDIRSLKLTKEFFDRRGEDSFVNYLSNTNSVPYDSMVRRTAEDADMFADLIFNWRWDQLSYLTKPTVPWPYALRLAEYPYEFQVPKNESDIRIVHAPSHSIVKGTPLVRAAIQMLREEGRTFQYVELENVENEVVLKELGRSHIVLQEFYCLSPGVLGIEALARGNAVLMAASKEMNPELPVEGKEPWVVTRYWQIADRLRALLDNPERIEEFARNGRAFVENQCSLERARQHYQEAFSERGINFEITADL